MGRTRSAAALSRPAVPRHARRVSGPVARPVPVPGQPRARGGRTELIPQAHNTFGATVRALPDHRLLDTLLRSRAWIWLLGISLGGIVFMQVSLLGMNAGIGRAVAQSTELEHSNAQLQDTIAGLSGDDRVRAYANRLGLITPSAGDNGYLKVRPRLDARKGAERMIAPSDEARAALGNGGLPAAASTAAAAAATTTQAVVPAATAGSVATPAPVVAATPAPTAAAPVATAAPTVAAVAPSGTTGGAAPTP